MASPLLVFPMLFRIRHSLHYRYDCPVFLEPLTVRLTPRQDSSQQLVHHTLEVEAAPSGRSAGLDADGNSCEVVWFDDLRQSLDLTVTMEVETLRDNPFDWIITDPAVATLPARYDTATSLSLSPFLARQPVDPSVAIWAADLAVGVEGATAPFLMALADAIHHGFHHVGRPDGDPMEPAETLAGRSGACRDTAMLYVAACRSQGLAARFVSGYSMHHPPEVTEQELHAWAEVYLPGAGWRAYDPSLGLAVADGHVVLAVAPDHRLAAPLSGSYRGTGVGSTMDYRVALQAVSR
jgi:transglutaminase-like putative cysteine protease